MADDLGLSAHDAAMVAKIDAASAALMPVEAQKAAAAPAPAAPVVAPAVRPAHIPEKFWDSATGTTNVEAMAKSYAELERGRAAPPAAAAPVAAPVDPVAVPEEGAPVVPAAPAAVDYQAVTAEYTRDGKLSEARYAELAAAGNSRAVVDQFIEGQKAQAQVAEFQQAAAVSEAHAYAGGVDAYRNMLTWAAAEMSAADQAAFDVAVTGDSASRKQALTSLKANYVAARGSEPRLVAGEGQSDGQGAFASRAEVTKAMSDPRYRKDPAYRALVERRVGAMPVF